MGCNGGRCAIAPRGGTRACGHEASGGIRTIDQALELIVAGATRLGTWSRFAPGTIPWKEEQIIKVVGSDLF